MTFSCRDHESSVQFVEPVQTASASRTTNLWCIRSGIPAIPRVATETAPEAQLHDLKEQARRRLQKRRDFGAHVMVYLLVNGWDVHVAGDITDDQIQREIDRMRHAGR